MRATLFTLAALLPLALSNSAAAQRPVPPEQMPLPNERVLQTPYWWAWERPDDDVKRPLNVIGEAEAKALIEAFKSPHAAFVNARSYMFYEPGVILTQPSPPRCTPRRISQRCAWPSPTSPSDMPSSTCTTTP